MIGMGMNVLAFDPFLTQERANSLGVSVVELEKIITDSDFITVHTLINS